LPAKVGTIPSDYTQGSGTLASGTTADKATEAALTAYPGGVIDRVLRRRPRIRGPGHATTSCSAEMISFSCIFLASNSLTIQSKTQAEFSTTPEWISRKISI